MANAQGGWIIFGISEDDSPDPLPVTLTPLNATGLQTRLENIVDSAIEPVPEYQAATIHTDQGVVLLVRIDPAAGMPSMVQGYDQNRYFIRSGTRTRPMNASEVAKAHTAAQKKAEDVRERLRGLPLIAGIGPEMRILPIGEVETAPVICLVVAAMDAPEELVDRSLIRRDSFPENDDRHRAGRLIRKPPWSITTFGLMEEESLPPPPPSGPFSIGFDIQADDDRLKTHRLGVYRAGVVEWARRYPRGALLPSTSMADDLQNSFLFAAQVFAEVKYFGRLKVWVLLDYAEGATLELPAGWDMSPSAPRVSTLEFICEVASDRLSADPTPITRAALDAIWQGFGLSRCFLFDENGTWRE